jgi:hypothetical protein
MNELRTLLSSSASMLEPLLSHGAQVYHSAVEDTSLCQGALVALAVFACWSLSRMFHKVSIRALYESY